MPQPLPPTLPPELKPPLEALGARLERLVPDRLTAAMFYGGLAKGKVFTDSSDVNLLVVLPPRPEALEAVAGPLREARRAAGVAPLIVSEGELDAALRAFPVKFHDICGHHRTWIGTDPLAGREVPPERLRESVRQDLANLSLRLKRLFVDRGGSAGALEEGLIDMLSPAIVALRPVLREKGVTVPDRREEVLEAAARAVGTEPSPLLALMALKKGATPPAAAEPAALHRALLSTIEAAAKALA